MDGRTQIRFKDKKYQKCTLKKTKNSTIIIGLIINSPAVIYNNSKKCEIYIRLFSDLHKTIYIFFLMSEIRKNIRKLCNCIFNYRYLLNIISNNNDRAQTTTLLDKYNIKYVYYYTALSSTNSVHLYIVKCLRIQTKQ